MQAIILAAGMGTRLGKYTKDNTKCMVPVNGRTLIERALDALDSAGLKKCIIVAGYKKDKLIDFLGNQYKNIKITWVINDIYNKTNNIYSLYLAKDYLLEDDTILLESDVIFEDRIITDLLKNPEPTLAVLAPYEPWMDGTVAQISDDNIISNFISKKFFNYNDKASYYKTVNIYKFSQDFLQNCYVPFLEAYSKTKGYDEYYEQVLKVISTLEDHKLKAMVLHDQKWYEIDDVQDKDIAEIIFLQNPDEKLKKIHERYGGYWRFPTLLDFCYPVNPYFPSGQMLNEIKAYFDKLLTGYPSGLAIQNMLMAKLFSLETENVICGNGAAELIQAISPCIKGRVGIIHPTFNEYTERFTSAELVPLSFESINYGLKELLMWSEKYDTLILINPDNPSGNYIPKSDVLTLLAELKRQNKKLLLDESFVDFSDTEDETLLQNSVLEEYPHLVVIKSLSKSYGIPGLRLGVLASADKDLIQKVRKQIPIWNINSFAEYFLQIIGKYTKEYRSSCRQIASERQRFYMELQKTGLLEPYPSQANYFLCRLNKGLNSRDLACYLLDQHDILIKELDSKKGLPEGSWLRLAIRNTQDNDKLLEKLVGYGSSLESQ